MKKTKNEILTTLLQTVSTEDPCIDFTSNVMEQITIDIQQELNIDTDLEQLIISNTQPLPYKFTSEVMASIIPTIKEKRHPILSLKTGIVFISMCFILVVFSFFTHTKPEMENISTAKTYVDLSDTNIVIITATIIALSLLMLLDYSLKKTPFNF